MANQTSSDVAGTKRGYFMRWKKYLGALPFVIFLVLRFVVSLIEGFTETELRSVPKMVLLWGGIFSGLLSMFWMGSIFFKWNPIKKWKGAIVLKGILLLVSICISLGVMGAGMFFSAFEYETEYVIERNGIHMVASVDSFLQEIVDYYEYKNAVFRGAEQIGWEDYGNGGGDPFKEGREPDRWFFKDLNGNVVESGGKN